MRRPPRVIVEQVAAHYAKAQLTDDLDELMRRPDKPDTPERRAEWERLMGMDE